RMNRLLHDHARGLLEEYCVRDLGCLCSHLEMDTPTLLASIAATSLCPPGSANQSEQITTTVPHLSSPLRIADFTVALQRVHSQFEWPYPVPSSRVVEQLAKRFAGIKSSASSACLSDTSSDMIPPLTSSSSTNKKSFTDENSFVITPINEVPTDVENASTNGEVLAIMEQITGPQTGYYNGARDYRSGSPSVSSVKTSGGMTMDDASSMNGGMPGGLQMEPLLGPNEAVKGNEIREAQLRYMIGAFAEIAAMDWVFILSVVLRDAAIARSSLSVAAGRRAGAASMQRLRVGCRQLVDWASLNCIGYVHILHVFDGHLSILCEALGAVEHPSAPQAVPSAVTKPMDQSKPALPAESAAAAQLARSRALRDAFGCPGAAVRLRDAAPSTRALPHGLPRARSRSVDRGAERAKERSIRVSGEDAVSTVAVEEGADCSLM
ncbi:hypothetical protein PMAYCL1PPCAC_09867, partial [Pristionchus mayeri]